MPDGGAANARQRGGRGPRNVWSHADATSSATITTTQPPMTATSDRTRVPPGRPRAREITLADLGPGEMARVTRIGSPACRELFAGLGVVEGAAVRVRRTGRWCIVDTAQGLVALDRAVACCATVERERGGPLPAPALG